MEVPGLDRVADPGRDIVALPDVQGLARAAEPDTELPAAQERREPAGARQQLHRLADDALLERLSGSARAAAAADPASAHPGRPDPG